jgi:hypothetical protein
VLRIGLHALGERRGIRSGPSSVSHSAGKLTSPANANVTALPLPRGPRVVDGVVVVGAVTPVDGVAASTRAPWLPPPWSRPATRINTAAIVAIVSTPTSTRRSTAPRSACIGRERKRTAVGESRERAGQVGW